MRGRAVITAQPLAAGSGRASSLGGIRQQRPATTAPPPRPPLSTPGRLAAYRSNRPLPNRISSVDHPRQVQDLLLDVGRQENQPHDLRHPGDRHAAESRELGVVPNDPFVDEPAHPDGQGHEAGDPWEAPWLNGRRRRDLAERGCPAPPAAGRATGLDRVVDREGAGLSRERHSASSRAPASWASALIPAGR